MSMLGKVLAMSKEVQDRYDARSGERAAAKDRIESGRMLDPDDEQVQKRLSRLAQNPDTYDTTGDMDQDGAKGLVGTPKESASVRERILGVNDLISVHFLEKGWRSARAVGRIDVSFGQSYGTGFMISPRLMLTNNHVLPDEDATRLSFIEFDYQYGADGRRLRPQKFDFVADDFFLTNEDLDFTLVAVAPTNERDLAVVDYGWLPLIGDEGKVIKGELLNIIQHPGGKLKQIGLRENQLEDILEHFLHYHTDTAPGSSGAPVFNDQWELVALHHAGVPQEDEDGNLLTLDGRIWDETMDESELAWRANEGVRISRIVAFINDQDLPEPAAALWAEAQTGEGPPLGPASAPPPAATRTVIPQSMRTRSAGSIPDGAPQALVESLAELENFSERTYYDTDEDTVARSAYYGDLAAGSEPQRALDLTTADGWHIIVARENSANGEEAVIPGFQQLHDLLQSTHANQPRYEPSRHVYPWVDLHPDGRLRSIYSGKAYDPADFITEDFAIESQRAQQLESFRARESVTSEALMAGFEALLEAQLPYNCEHVVPQSWFMHEEPMRGDLHHLFACESGCNSFRSNIPYFDFEDFGEATRSECGKRVGNKFEPDAGKGAIARAFFYFLVRYPGLIEDHENEFERERLPFLLAWHERYGVTAYERHRNSAIFAVQGNRNPFIDFPQWVPGFDFARGLG